MVSLKPDPNEKGEARSRAKREVPIISRAWYLWVHFHWAWRWNFSKAPWQEGKFPGLNESATNKSLLPITSTSHRSQLPFTRPGYNGNGNVPFFGRVICGIPRLKVKNLFSRHLEWSFPQKRRNESQTNLVWRIKRESKSDIVSPNNFFLVAWFQPAINSPLINF